MGRNAGKVKEIEIPDDITLSGIATLGSLIGMEVSKGTKYQSCGAILGGFVGFTVGYFLVKRS